MNKANPIVNLMMFFDIFCVKIETYKAFLFDLVRNNAYSNSKLSIHDFLILLIERLTSSIVL